MQEIKNQIVVSVELAKLNNVYIAQEKEGLLSLYCLVLLAQKRQHLFYGHDNGISEPQSLQPRSLYLNNTQRA